MFLIKFLRLLLMILWF